MTNPCVAYFFRWCPLFGAVPIELLVVNHFGKRAAFSWIFPYPCDMISWFLDLLGGREIESLSSSLVLFPFLPLWSCLIWAWRARIWVSWTSGTFHCHLSTKVLYVNIANDISSVAAVFFPSSNLFYLFRIYSVNFCLDSLDKLEKAGVTSREILLYFSWGIVPTFLLDC